MSLKKVILRVVMRDDCYDVNTGTCSARYALNGNAIMKIGSTDELPDVLHITDARTKPNQECAQLLELVRKTVTERLREESRPGGLLSGR